MKRVLCDSDGFFFFCFFFDPPNPEIWPNLSVFQEVDSTI